MQEFKLIVAGSRGFTDYAKLSMQLMRLANNDLDNKAVSIVSGMARGADALAVRFAKEHGVKLYEYPANWDKYGKRAGFLRNEQMGQAANGLLAFWDGESRGTKHMIECMEAQGKPLWIINY
jgi:hypothetical protein